MSRNSSSSMFGGAGGRGARASVSSLQGLRNALRPDSEQQPLQSAPPAPVQADDKKTMEGLNQRLSGYLDKVKKLETSNQEMKDQMKDLQEKMAQTTDHDWDEIEKPLDELREEIHKKTIENAQLLLQVDSTKLANDDYKNKLKAEQDARQNLEHDLAELRQAIDNMQMERFNLESQIESAKEELAYLKKNHYDDITELKEKIKDSNVKVEVDSPQSNLSETINKIRMQYEKLAQKNYEEINEWYQTKFESINVELTKNTETLQSSRTDICELRRQKNMQEIEFQTIHNTIMSLEETLENTQGQYTQQLVRQNLIIQQLEAELSKVQGQVKKQSEDYQTLLNIKMELEAEIKSYRQLMGGLDNSVDFTLEQALQSNVLFSPVVCDGGHSSRKKAVP
ncbi:keratin, type I cytoskeletal 18-like [Trichomycterus rosablanca]|uniref:keratin, type I cytoskeletal 18-like n=1 Tax=Trichomycterus rosablanca TaxID=2290929 RepID=UPI002F360C73